MHGGVAFLLIHLNVVAELRVHQRLGILAFACLEVLIPQELLGDAVTKHLFVDVVHVRKTPVGDSLLRLGEHEVSELRFGHVISQRPADSKLSSALFRLDNGLASYAAGLLNLTSCEIKAEKPQYFVVFGH